MCTSLDQARQGRNAILQLQALAREGCLTDREFDRLTQRALDGFDQMMGPRPFPAPPKATSPFTVHRGGRP